MRSDADRLSDILDAIAKVEARITGGLDTFLRDEMVRVWTMANKDLLALEEQVRQIRSGITPESTHGN